MPIDYESYKPRPTFFDGLMFRSKLEATWAAFFKFACIEWEYEPKCNFVGWLPDFVIYPAQGGDPIYCEVKPLSAREDKSEIALKISQTCTTQSSVRVAVLGTSVFVSRVHRRYTPMIGWFANFRDGDTKGWRLLPIEHVLHINQIDPDPETFELLFLGVWKTATIAIAQTYGIRTFHEACMLVALEDAPDVRTKQQLVIDYNRGDRPSVKSEKKVIPEFKTIDEALSRCKQRAQQ